MEPHKMKMIETIFDVVTQETTVIERDFTKDEIAERKAAAKIQAEREAEEQTKASERQSILDRLGLTAEEAALLLG
jgi:hypothetical protein